MNEINMINKYESGAKMLLLLNESHQSQHGSKPEVEAFKWTTQMESRFIALLRQEKNIWKASSAHYKSRQWRRVSFTQIGAKLLIVYPQHASEFTPKKLQKKFSSLKTIFQRNLKKVKDPTNGALPIPWVHFNSLLFLEEDVEADSFSDLEGSDKDFPTIIQKVEAVEVKDGKNNCISENGQTWKEDTEEDTPSFESTACSFTEDNSSEKEISVIETFPVCEIDENPHEQEESKMNLEVEGPLASTCKEPDISMDCQVQESIFNKNKPKAQAQNTNKREPEEELLSEAVKASKRIPPPPNDSPSPFFEDACGQYVAQLLKSIPDIKKRHIAHKKIMKTAFKCLLE